MPIYWYWGEDEFRLKLSIKNLEQKVLDPGWKTFNFDRIDGTAANGQENLVQGLNQAVTPPFGMGDRLVWIEQLPFGSQGNTAFFSELERTLPAVPATSHLLFTYLGKPDGRSKIVKLLQQQAQSQEFALIPPWKTEELHKVVRQGAQQFQLKLANAAVEQLAEAVGNDTRQLFCELEKLKLYLGKTPRTVEVEDVALLVSATRQNSLDLAAAIRQGQTEQALSLVERLLQQNEPALRICATLVKQFRTWLWVKILQEAGERDERAIAQAAEVGNPKRVYFLTQEIKHLSSQQLQQALSLLLELEMGLKQGQNPTEFLQIKVIELCLASGTKMTSKIRY
jgi:DNA polymerase III subunit delta